MKPSHGGTWNTASPQVARLTGSSARHTTALQPPFFLTPEAFRWCWLMPVAPILKYDNNFDGLAEGREYRGRWETDEGCIASRTEKSKIWVRHRKVRFLLDLRGRNDSSAGRLTEILARTWWSLDMRLVELGLGFLYHLTSNHSSAPSYSHPVHIPCRLALLFSIRHFLWLLVAAVYNNTQWQPALWMLPRALVGGCTITAIRWPPVV